MKNFRKSIAAATLSGIIILTTTAVNAGIIMSDAVPTNPCEGNNVITTTIDGILSATGITNPGTLCGIIMSD